MPKDLPLRLIELASGRARTVFAVFLLLLVAASLVIGRIRIETDVLALVPRENPVVRDFQTTLERFGSTDLLLVALELDPAAEKEAYFAYADELAEALAASPRIDWVEAGGRDLLTAATELLDHATLFMTPAEIDTLLARLDDDAALAATVRELAARLRTPLTLAFKETLVADPMGMLPLLWNRFKVGDLGPGLKAGSGYLVDPEGRLLLLLVKPVRPAADIVFSRTFMTELDEIKAEVDAAWQEAGREVAPPGAIYGGGYAIAVEDDRLVYRDLVVGAVGSLAGVVGLFAFAFRRKTALVIAFVPLVAGLVLTFAFAAVVLGRLNSVTTGFAALLIGLGVDFVIVLYGRYAEGRSRGLSHAQALAACGRHTAVGVLLGAVTTAATFYAFLVSGFAGLYELGLLTGTGILILVVTVFLLLPALLTLLDRRRPERPHRLRSFGSEYLCDWSLRHPRATVAVAAVLTLGLGAFAWQVRYDDDVLNMRSTDNRGIQNQQRIMDAFGIRFTPIMIRLDGASEDAVLDEARQLLPRLEALVEDQTLARVDSLAAWIPSREQQQEVLRRLAERAVDPAVLSARLTAALRAAGLNPRAFQPGIEHLTAALTARRTFHVGELADTSLGHLLGRFLATGDGTESTVIYSYPPAGKWRREIPPALAAAVAETPGAVLTGPLVVSKELKKIVLRDAAIAAALGTLLVLVLMWLDLGGLREAVLALLPLAVGMVWMVGLMVLLGIPVNFMNIFVFTMIIGIGVDYGIHLFHRWHETGGDLHGLGGTSRAITMAALTTMMGFGSLVLSHYPGLRSMGAVAILGASTTALASMTLLPALLELLWPHGGERR